MLEVVDPAEREVFGPFVEDLESHLSRLGLIEEVDLGRVSGVDLEVEGLEVDARELAPGLAEVMITGGTVSYETRPEEVPVGDVLRDLIEANGGEVDIPRERDRSEPFTREDGIFVVATETGGRWHLSLGFTLAEHARRDAGLPLPDPDAGVLPQGAAGPEEAVRELASAAADLEEGGILHRLFTGDLELFDRDDSYDDDWDDPYDDDPYDDPWEDDPIGT